MCILFSLLSGNRVKISRLKGRVALITFGVVVALFALEVGARVWIALRWPAELTYALTHHTDERGRFTSDPELGYRLRPNFRDPSGRFTHNSYGFRGREFQPRKSESVFRVVLAGGSTIYGIYVGDEDTCAAQLERRLSKLLPNQQVEVLNAGVPGWNSAETVRNLSKNVMNLDPDFNLVCEGRNEVFPQLFKNYRPDYSHYRRQGYNFRDSNYLHKTLFRISHLFMLISARGGGYLGFSYKEEDPPYAVINYDNAPSAEDILSNVANRERELAFQHNLEDAVRLGWEKGIITMLSTIPFRAEAYGSGVIARDARTLPAITQQVNRNNEITRRVARELSCPLIDASSALTRAELLEDDCHFNEQGEAAFADLILAAMTARLSQVANRTEH